MILIKKLDQIRRDFQGKYECEFCGCIDTDKSMDSYDDNYFHQNVIPNMKCPNCGCSTISEGAIINVSQPKYPDGYQI